MVKAIFLDIDGTLRDECSGVPQSAYTAVRMCRGKRNPDTDMHGAESGFHSGGNPVHGYRRHHSRRRLSDRGKRICAEGKLFSKTGTERIQEYLLTRELPFAMESQERIFMNRAAAVLLRQDFIGKLKGLGAEEIRKREKENSIPYEDTLKEYMTQPGSHTQILSVVPA